MIEWLWSVIQDFGVYLQDTYDPFRDTLDIALVTFGIYWLLTLLRGTRAVQILVGLFVLIGALVASRIFELVTTGLILNALLAPGVIILVVLFQHDIRRALARMGRGFFRPIAAEQESQVVEVVVRAAQSMSQRRIGALIVLERETGLADQIESGITLDAEASKELIVSIFVPTSPLHDGAVIVQRGRLAAAGAILPLTLNADLPDGVGTRHRAAVGITEETDAVVVVVSEETASISVVMGGEIIYGLDGPRLRKVLAEALGRTGRELPALVEGPEAATAAEGNTAPARTAS
ncbi:MAG: TIGR00159 family protein [Deltaproteobacteria bacterium]|nr:TIGR00159 family protein [Deltaproteobacteria bacterium]MBW2360402.1 TIGR00159 family protein [Deltaproteobacteria bacterium]